MLLNVYIVHDADSKKNPLCNVFYFDLVWFNYYINDKSDKYNLIFGIFLQFCKENMEGKSFYAKGGKIFCKAHAAKY